jgi:hypothetical protein
MRNEERMKVKASGGTKFLSHQIADNLADAPVGGVSLNVEPRGAKPVNFHQMSHVPRKVTGAAGINGGGGLRPEFIQGVSFFFGHSCHTILHVSKKHFPGERSPGFAAFHRMKYVDVPFFNKIIQNFKQVGIGIKADEQVFVDLSRYWTVKNRMHESVPDVGLGNAMLKGGLIEFYTAIHRSSIPHRAAPCKSPAEQTSRGPALRNEETLTHRRTGAKTFTPLRPGMRGKPLPTRLGVGLKQERS